MIGKVELRRPSKAPGTQIQTQGVSDECKADCVWVGRKILEANGKSRSTTFVQREKRNFQTAQNGVFPSVAIFAGQLKRNQLYMFTFAADAGTSFCEYVHVHTCNVCVCVYKYTSQIIWQIAVCVKGKVAREGGIFSWLYVSVCLCILK